MKSELELGVMMVMNVSMFVEKYSIEDDVCTSYVHSMSMCA